MTDLFISDPHFGHKNIITFRKDDGSLLRPFSSVEEMDEFMVDKWNGRVRPHDRIYVLGDVAINRKALSILDRLNGRKVLIKGNHDIFKLKEYTPYFKDIRAYKILPKHGIICSHIPIHPESLNRWKTNLHGHLHSKTLEDTRYLNVCMEQLNYTPISLEEILVKLENNN